MQIALQILIWTRGSLLQIQTIECHATETVASLMSTIEGGWYLLQVVGV